MVFSRECHQTAPAESQSFWKLQRPATSYSYSAGEFRNREREIEPPKRGGSPYLNSGREKTKFDKVDFKNVLLIGDDSKISIGKPFITNAKVTGELVRHFREKKILVFKKKRRKNYRKTYGHRQPVSELKIVNITLDGTKISTTKSKSLQKKTEITSIT